MRIMEDKIMKRTLVVYGAVCYLAFLATVLYTVGFLANVLVPKSIDAGTAAPFWQALLVDVGLLTLFSLQHSGMARRAFKERWRAVFPEAAERSTYVLMSSLTLAVLFWQWQPLPTVLWSVSSVWGQIPIWAVYALGWILVLVSARLISSGHLFGLQQVREHATGQSLSSPEFQTPSLYRYVRHPLMLGFLMAFWATPHFTVGRLLFALGLTIYIVAGLWLEERDLMRTFGERYRVYRSRVPMLIPSLRSNWQDPDDDAEYRARSA